MAASNKMFTREQFELINDMVRLLRPIILRPVIIVRKAFIQKPKMPEKIKTKTGYRVQIYDKKQQNFPNNKTQQKFHQQISGKKELKAIESDISEQIL